MHHRLTSLPFAIVVPFLAACGGGGGSGTGSVEGLSIPSQMTVVAANDSQTGSARIIPEGTKRPKARIGTRTLLTDYQSDVTRIWVHDESLAPLDTINMILKMLGKTGYADPDVVNGDPYIALVPDDEGSEGSDPTNGGSSSSGQAAVAYKEWRILSERASADAPHVVKFWIDWAESNGGDERIPARLYGKLTIFESPTDVTPYGKFTLNFKMLAADAADSSVDTIFIGNLSTVSRDDGLAEYTLYHASGDVTTTPAQGHQAFLERARVVTTSTGATGKAYSSNISKRNDHGTVHEDSSTYHLAYNEHYLARRKVTGTEDVEVFDRQDFTTYPWNYGLYDATSEARVDLNSGFSIKTASGGVFGYAGYHGVWFPDSVTIADGLAVVRDSRGAGGTPQEFTIAVAPGRLEKRTRIASTLGNLQNENLYTWDSNANRNITVQWTGTDLVQTSYFDQGSGRWITVDPAVSVLGNYAPYQWVGLNSPARGEINFSWPSAGTPTDATPVAIWQVRAINADSPELASGDLTLHAYVQMLRSDITQAQANWQSGQSPYFPDALNVAGGKDYVFSKSTLTLTLLGQNVTLADGVTVTSGPNSGGFTSGPMVTSPLTLLTELPDQTTTYRWQTGSQSWNRLRTLKDANGAFVEFDAPLVFQYTHVEPGNTRFHNKVFQLEYQGAGQLHGVPFEEDAETHRWYPVFTIPSGTLLTNSTGTYKVKILQAEQRMRSVSNPTQVIDEQGLDINNTLTPPTNTYQDPAIGPRPTVDTPPLYIDGVKQTS